MYSVASVFSDVGIDHIRHRNITSLYAFLAAQHIVHSCNPEHSSALCSCVLYSEFVKMMIVNEMNVIIIYYCLFLPFYAVESYYDVCCMCTIIGLH